MANRKLTEKDFKEINSRTGIEYYTIDEKLVKHILDDQEIVKRLRFAINKYDKMGKKSIVNILKEILEGEG